MTLPQPSSGDQHSKVLGDARWLLIERIAASQHFKTSARLREFLFYISDCAIREAPEEATEQQIGVHVFQRHPGYNSSEDSIVRTHARLLRQKLATYYVEEGRDEKVIVEVPKGHYLPVFHIKDTEAGLAVPALLPGLHPEPIRTRNWKMAGAFLLFSVLAAGALLFWGPWSRRAASRTAVDIFWQPFFTDDPPLVIFSNALFVGDSIDGLRYAPLQSEDGTRRSDNLVDTYTGIGELASVYTLTRLFDAHQARFILKRSLLMTWDEAKTKNLIFIGSIVENPSLRVLESTKDFTLAAKPGYAGIINHDPKPGEPAAYWRQEHPLTKDYAILALLPGVQPGKRMLIFSGLTTFGTQGAVEYVSHIDTATELLRKVTGPNGEIRPFEAVLDVEVGGGVPLETKLVSLHVH